MKLQDYIDTIKIHLGGQILDLELTDDQLGQVVNVAFRECVKYIDETVLITIPYAKCIDLKGFRYSTLEAVYRATGFYGESVDSMHGRYDPMYAQQWMIFSNGGTMYNLNDYVMNFLSWNTLLQMKNTISTDLSYVEDKHNEKLYINCDKDIPEKITICYVPQYRNVEDIKSDFWIDIIQRLAVAHAKVTIGHIRSRFTQSNALWSQDGESLLTEGNEELKALREELNNNNLAMEGVQ